ncbi:MAG: glycosyltransferase family 39 protein [Candidatus Daviesbacteria bacterium]|nr:glycosyltransferase family 39 protein [Candidatus Daviesbacteria bacterium]
MKILKIFANQYFWLIIIIIGAFAVRLYKIDSPIADWHSWRQSDTAAVTRNFIKEGFNPFFPKYDDMSGVSENPVINPATFRFVEFPIYNIVVYPLYLFFGVADVYSRLVSVLFSLGSITFLYFICKRYFGVVASLFTAAVYAVLPFNVFFSRTTLPEPTFLFFALGMMYFMDRWIEKRKGILGISGFIFTAIAFLMKPWAIFFFLPLLYSVYKTGNRGFWKKFVLFTFFALLPFVLWRLWILQEPQGIPASGWLMNGDGIRFRPAFWWWLVSERIGREILGATGLALFTIGLLIRPKNGNYFMHAWVLSLFLYFAIFATGNVRHNYYQYIFVPVAAVFFAQGFLSLVKGVSDFLPRFWTIILGLLFLILSFYFSWNQVKEFYRVNNPVIVEAGKKADQILPKDAIVLAPYNGDTAFLYQTNRAGFAVGVLPIPELVSDYGVTHYVSTARDDKTNWVLRHFQILEDNPRFIIVDLQVIKAPLILEDPEP